MLRDMCQNQKAPPGAFLLNGGNNEACLARSRLTGLRLTPFMTLSYRHQPPPSAHSRRTQ